MPPLRVVLTGSESTGKTRLAARLAEHFGARLVEEFVRVFAREQGRALEFSDHGPIARGQMALEDAALSGSPHLIVQDTDLLSTVVYCRHYFGRCPEWIEQEARARRPDLYLLCDIDLPWVEDGIRDRGDRRGEMQGLFEVAVGESATPAVRIAGSAEQRWRLAAAAIESLNVSPPA